MTHAKVCSNSVMCNDITITAATLSGSGRPCRNGHHIILWGTCLAIKNDLLRSVHTIGGSREIGCIGVAKNPEHTVERRLLAISWKTDETSHDLANSRRPKVFPSTDNHSCFWAMAAVRGNVALQNPDHENKNPRQNCTAAIISRFDQQALPATIGVVVKQKKNIGKSTLPSRFSVLFVETTSSNLEYLYRFQLSCSCWSLPLVPNVCLTYCARGRAQPDTQVFFTRKLSAQ